MAASPAFPYAPGEEESEKASNGYLMALVAVMLGTPLPIVNLIATLIFFLANRKAAYFVRWHCIQALLAQAFLFLVNAAGFSWTFSIVFGSNRVTSAYVAYVLTAILVNLAELAAVIYAAIVTRKGRHVKWWFFGSLTDSICGS